MAFEQDRNIMKYPGSDWCWITAHFAKFIIDYVLLISILELRTVINCFALYQLNVVFSLRHIASRVSSALMVYAITFQEFLDGIISCSSKSRFRFLVCIAITDSRTRSYGIYLCKLLQGRNIFGKFQIHCIYLMQILIKLVKQNLPCKSRLTWNIHIHSHIHCT